MILNLHLHVGTVDLGPYWLAFERQTGIAVFADDEDSATRRLSNAVDFALDNLGDDSVRPYLDDRGVEYSISEDPPTHTYNIRQSREKEFAGIR